MDLSSMSGIPQCMGGSDSFAMLRREYIHTYIEEKLELDANAIVEVQSKLHNHVAVTHI
jgi:hypothetical protein